jgi:pimeloyl-ACP methyl ester carboxylesterase
LVIALLGAFALAGPAQADFGSCPSPQSQPSTCETLTVPLDRSGAVPGSIHLFVERRAPAGASQAPPLLVLAGGPGQAASPLIDQIQQLLAPVLQSRDLIVFDQRGTGRSDPLDCPALDTASSLAQQDAAVEACANSLGPARAFYTSRDSADDIDAVRQSLGVDKVNLFGVSYGTFAAVTYARRHPDHIQSLVLDSNINPNGRDPLDRTTYQAFPRVLRDVCGGRCGGITHDPVADLVRLVRRLRQHELSARAFLPDGKRIRGTIGEDDVRQVLEGADFDPTARAEIPGSLVSATRGDTAPLARLLIREQLTTGSQTTAQSQPGDSQALFFATSCEEIAFPWSRTAPLSDRPGALANALNAVPASIFAPFDRQSEADLGTSRPCLRWPDGSPSSPLVTGPVPNVPVLLLEGMDDTRTPIADAQATASLFPQAQLLTVPETGHSVLGSDPSTCSETAITSFFSGATVSPCPATPRLFPPTPIAPTSLAAVHPVRGVKGKRGKTVAGVAATLTDSTRQALSFALSGTPIRVGGLRGGRMAGSLVGTVLTLHLNKLIYVPGVVVSGTISVDFGSNAPPVAHVTVSGHAASKGSLTFNGGRFAGKLDNHRVHSRAKAAAAAFAPQRIPFAALLRLRSKAPLRAGSAFVP